VSSLGRSTPATSQAASSAPAEVGVAQDEARWIVGVDIGGTNLVVGLVPVDGGSPLALRKLPTRAEEGGEAVVARVVAMAREAIGETLSTHAASPSAVAGVGIGSPGPLNRNTGVVLTTPNLGWRDFPLRDLIAGALELPATLDNDANCATFGEWWMGAGRGESTVVGVTLGTGIGGGIVLDGELFHGVSDAAGEIGHMTINFAGRRCKCGNEGCLEAYASGPNIAARAVEGIHAGIPSLLVEMVDGELDRITAALVSEAAVRGDVHAHEVMQETGKLLGVGVASILNILNPGVVVVAGGVTRAGDHLFEPLRAEVRRRAFRSAVDACRIVPAALPETAGVIGAAGVFRRAVLGRR